MTRAIALFSVMCSLANLSCREEIDLTPQQDTPAATANALLGMDSTIAVFLTKPKSILSSGFVPFYEWIMDANVTVFDLTNSETRPLNFSLASQSYNTDVRPLPGHGYRLHVEIPNAPGLEAETSVPEPALLNFVTVDSSNYNQDDRQIKLTLGFNDRPEPNLYRIVLLKHISDMSGDEAVVFSPINPALDNEFSSGSDLLFDDKLFDGKDFELALKVRHAAYQSTTPSPLRVVLVTCSQEYYRYLTSKNLQENIANDPFSEPVQVYSNIQNGLGIFAGYSTSVLVLE